MTKTIPCPFIEEEKRPERTSFSWGHIASKLLVFKSRVDCLQATCCMSSFLLHWVSKGKGEVLKAEKCIQQKNCADVMEIELPKCPDVLQKKTSQEKRKSLNPLEMTISWWKSFYILEQEALRRCQIIWADRHLLHIPPLCGPPWVPKTTYYLGVAVLLCLEEVHVCLLIYEGKK